METFNLSPSHPSWFISGSVPAPCYWEGSVQEIRKVNWNNAIDNLIKHYNDSFSSSESQFGACMKH